VLRGMAPPRAWEHLRDPGPGVLLTVRRWSINGGGHRPLALQMAPGWPSWSNGEISGARAFILYPTITCEGSQQTKGYCWRIIQYGPKPLIYHGCLDTRTRVWGIRQQYPSVFETQLLRRLWPFLRESLCNPYLPSSTRRCSNGVRAARCAWGTHEYAAAG
jgi:hypothetical protein